MAASPPLTQDKKTTEVMVADTHQQECTTQEGGYQQCVRGVEFIEPTQ